MFQIIKIWLILLLCSSPANSSRFTQLEIHPYGINDLKNDYGGDIISSIIDMIQGFDTEEITICYNSASSDFIQLLMKRMLNEGISTILFNISSVSVQDEYFDFVKKQTESHFKVYSLLFGNSQLYEHILLEVQERNLIRRNLVYVFYWGSKPFHRYFIKNIQYAMKVFAVTNPKNDTFRLYYSQATSHREHHLEKINWWQSNVGLFYHPTVPIKKSVYKDFHGKVFKVPVLHKPPWHFVEYNNNSIEVLGGRDDRILSLLSKKLNFRYEYIDPIERIQGTAGENGEFNGVLGLIWKREADLFIGDVALTYERADYMEFSFLTLADSGAFVTHAPSKLNEALALLRPFQWQVWPAIGITFIIVGPVLYTIIALPNWWQPRFTVRSQARLFFDCTWFTITILLRQTAREPSSSHKARIFIILLSISATYVINDMYSANLTSLLAKPVREKAINNLNQLEKAVLLRDYNLYVESHSSSFSLLENGTGVYGRLWNLMTRQNKYLVESVEEGVKLVRDATNNVLIAGRETLFFDIQRFGASNFHLSQKLNTAYSAIALQIGCPYIEEINRILMIIFEAGIITKMTENEYEKLGKQKALAGVKNLIETNTKKVESPATKKKKDNEKLMPINLKMLQGAFYLLCIGNGLSGIVLMLEIFINKHHSSGHYKKKSKHCVWLKLIKKKIRRFFSYCINKIRQVYRNAMREAIVSTLDYIE